jgi:facilitated trehalose transporter
MNISATIFATFLIDRLGRKVLLLMSSSLMVLTLGSLGTFFFVNRELVKDPNPKALEEYVTEMGLGWIPLVSLMLYVLAFSIGFGPIPWLMLGEIFPSRIRGSAAAMATSFNWSCTFLVTLCFPIVTGALGAYAAFYGFCLICILGIPFIIFCVPETRGQSLEDIERNLPRPFRRISSTANLKPFPMSM